ncbi:alcohol dehydrogenase 1-like isoform X2 [Erinaceus europaeus]|uniref:Alcohol dehydrogenase 1-like isoform X2 n=1 Tax=Erinaceus europaeus TaxID=9365 RepID=A0ABM3X0H6_ERIEU|nr:alcohol dehydrogenase 1-like isoform X2 [Erinaceus europaeus]
MATEGTAIICRAAVAWTPDTPVSLEDVQVDPPKAGEVRIKILFSGLCGTDLHILEGRTKMPFPIILGHEGAGVVESVGEGVTTVKPGDHVLPLSVPQCRECRSCLHPKGNFCRKENIISPTGLMLDGTSRFTCKGKRVFNLYGTSTFSEYTVVSEIAVARVDKAAPLDRVCIMSCQVPTGFGAVVNTAKVTSGSTCVVIGLGGIGLAIVMACKASGAARIIGVDINEDKFPWARELGVTDVLNPGQLSRPVQEEIQEMTGGGADFAFEAVGLNDTMVATLESCDPSFGVAVLVGMAPSGQKLTFDPILMLPGRNLRGGAMGEYKTRDAIPQLVSAYLQGHVRTDPLITHRFPFQDIRRAFRLQQEGGCIRCVLRLGEGQEVKDEQGGSL